MRCKASITRTIRILLLSQIKKKYIYIFFKSNENIHKKEDGPYYAVSATKAEETYCNFANIKSAVDSKSDINKNGVKKNNLEYESKPIIYF